MLTSNPAQSHGTEQFFRGLRGFRKNSIEIFSFLVNLHLMIMFFL